MPVAFPRRPRARLRALVGAAAVAVAAAAVWPSGASALVIESAFVPAGERFMRMYAGEASAPAPTAGGGNLPAIFESAAALWETAIDDPRTFSIEYGWQDLTGGRLAGASRPTSRGWHYGVVRFDSSRGSAAFPRWFADPTPDRHEEYASYTETAADLGGGEINTGRLYTDAQGPARDRYDLLTLAAHEIGHVLGFLDAESRPRRRDAPSEFDDGWIVVSDGLPLAGTTARVTGYNGGHTDPAAHPETLMVPAFRRGERVLPSDLDVLLTAQLNGYRAPVLAASRVAVPAPASALLLGAGLLLLAGAAAVGRKRTCL